MAKLYDIQGYWEGSYTFDFNERDMWKGQILLEEDGWFEGIVVDPYSPYLEDRIVFGVYYPDKVIELFKLTPSGFSDPFVYHGQCNEDGYDGEVEVVGLFGPVFFAVSRIITQDAELTRENVDAEIEELRKRIRIFKKDEMDDIIGPFYSNYLAIRNSLCKIVLRNYEGRGFTAAEIEEIERECLPVNGRVVDAALEEVRKLTKEFPEDLLLDFEDDELPF